MNRPLHPSRRTLLKMAVGTATSPIAASLCALPALAQSGDLLARQINLAGRQRMLSQRISRAVFFLALEIEPKMHLRMISSAHRLFDVTLAGLRDGDAEMGLEVETRQSVLDELATVQGFWEPFGASITQIHERGSVMDDELAALGQINLELLRTSDNVVKALTAEKTTGSADLGFAVALNVAGRLRMLSQKSAKEVGMIALGLSLPETQAALGQSLSQFENSLTALIEGLPTVALPPPPEPVRAKLEEVAGMWSGYARAAQFVADVGIASPIELAAVTAQADPILNKVNDAVSLYETG